MSIALEQAADALREGEFPVGCVIVAGNTILATGKRANSAIEFSEIDHGEIIALRNLQKTHPDIDRSSVTIYTTMEPCLMCFSTLLVNNITKMVYAYEDVMGGGTNLPIRQLSPLYASLEISVTKHIMRQESLRLFQAFFGSASNDYLKGTLLAEYTLQQP
ncbi:nucleoside deaminase [Desulfosediminicola flagellatus]|uniref:nucleoside deaminase n=1 Tax=Desulfosediminicola flagellatus TaxID=2569541 RepID=UPI00226ABB32|nr:nucleoside deaminase [Desulfosediminicola flagellatus]